MNLWHVLVKVFFKKLVAMIKQIYRHKLNYSKAINANKFLMANIDENK